MKKTLTLSLVLFACAMPVYAASPAQKYGEVSDYRVTFYAGWNLFSAGVITEQVPAYPSTNDSLYLYAFNPKTQQYVGGNVFGQSRAKNDLDALFEDRDLNVDHVLDNGGAMSAFVYLTKDQAAKANAASASKSYPYATEFQPLWKGYNFLSITPAMVGKKLSDSTGDCKGLKAYMFDAEHQSWSSRVENEWISSTGDNGQQKNLIGLGLIVKVDADCTLRFKPMGSVPQVPAIPR